MTGHHLICYSTVDALEFTLRLADTLQAGVPSFPVWLDKRDLQPSRDWDEQIAEAIRGCESLLFVMTRDSVEDEPVCKEEWSRALKYKKLIVPLLLDADAEAPFRLASRQHIDFSCPFEPALARMRLHL